jgi:hypothetical protein
MSEHAKKKTDKVTVDLSGMHVDHVLKILELEWQDHIQTRQQTWQALQIAAILTAALVGIQWSSNHAVVGLIAAVLVIGVSIFGIQITMRHRNSTEVRKFTIIIAAEKRLGLRSEGLTVPRPVSFCDILAFWRSNTSLFLLRMQGIIHLIGWLMLVFSVFRLAIGMH